MDLQTVLNLLVGKFCRKIFQFKSKIFLPVSRRDRGIAPNVADRAGRWGDYRDCDSPWEVVEDAVRAARRNHPQIDIVYITGDFVDHGKPLKL